MNIYTFKILSFTTIIALSNISCDSILGVKNDNSLKRPDVGDSVVIDIDDDQVYDYEFYYFDIATTDVPVSAASTQLHLISLNPSSFFSSNENEEFYTNSQQIDGTINWSRNSINSLASINWSKSDTQLESWSGSWAGVNEKYILLKIIQDDEPHYGWLMISVGKNDGIVTINDLFLETQSNSVAFVGEE